MSVTLNKENIKKILPHRDPILLVDEAVLEPGSSVEASVYLDPAWEIFEGHFPDQPVLPGIYLTEAMAQTADLILLTIPGNEHKYPLFMGISQMRFLRAAVPGDTLTLQASIAFDAGNGIYDCNGTALLGEKKCAVGKITLALRDHTAR